MMTWWLWTIAGMYGGWPIGCFVIAIAVASGRFITKPTDRYEFARIVLFWPVWVVVLLETFNTRQKLDYERRLHTYLHKEGHDL